MRRRCTIRPFVCALLVLFLCAPLLPLGVASTVSSDRPIEVRALGPSTSGVLLGRADGRQDHSRRPSTPFLVVAPPSAGGGPDIVRGARSAQQCAPHCLATIGVWTGRAPPAIS